MKPQEIIEKLQKYKWEKHNIEYVMVFGSCLTQYNFHDIDLAIKFTKYSFDEYVNLLEGLSNYLKIREDHIDIVILNNENLPAQLILEIYTKGRLIYCHNYEEYLNEALRRINVSYDFLIDFKKLKVLETALKRVKEKWA